MIRLLLPLALFATMSQAATITFEDGSQVEFPDDWIVNIDITVDDNCGITESPSCEDDPKYCDPAQVCSIWPDYEKCNTQQDLLLNGFLGNFRNKHGLD